MPPSLSLLRGGCLMSFLVWARRGGSGDLRAIAFGALLDSLFTGEAMFLQTHQRPTLDVYRYTKSLQKGPEGGGGANLLHFNAKVNARLTLGDFFTRVGRRVYLACELAVDYPGEAIFAPDVIAVLDVENHSREKWVVGAEGKGVDFALEAYVAGNHRKDLVRNAEKYARPDSIVFEIGEKALHPCEPLWPEGKLRAHLRADSTSTKLPSPHSVNRSHRRRGNWCRRGRLGLQAAPAAPLLR